jgi:hypothetical protein
MQYILMEYVQIEGYKKLTKDELEYWMGAYRAYLEAMKKAGVLKSSTGLQPASTATTVRTTKGKPQVLDGPYADTKEQLGGFRIIETPDLDAAISWATRNPSAIHGVVEVRPLIDGPVFDVE